MPQSQHIAIQDDNELQKIVDQVKSKYYLFIIGIVLALFVAFLVNYLSIPVYRISSSLLIKEDKTQTNNVDDFLSNNLFGSQKRLQNELLVLKSSKVIGQAIRNLDLPVSYFQKRYFQYVDAYKNVPFRVLYSRNHVQPLGVQFKITFSDTADFELNADSDEALVNFIEGNAIGKKIENFSILLRARPGQLIESSDLSFMIEMDSTKLGLLKEQKVYYFKFTDIPTLTQQYQGKFEFNIVDKDATVIEVAFKTTSYQKGIDVVDELTNVYSTQNLQKKNYLASITIDYIDKQLADITDSLSQVEQKLQTFRSYNQLLNISEQATGITSQNRDLQNQRAELVTRRRYYDYVADYLEKNDDITNIIIPSSMGISDPMLNNVMAELITAQSQRNNLIENNQEKNPLVKKLGIEIDNLKRTIRENISYAIKTSDISLDEMNKRIRRVEDEITRLPKTQRQLGNIERNYRLNDAIYNYLLEKRAEANITKASNLPDYEIIEPASGLIPVSPNKKMNYLVALILGLMVPLGYIRIGSSFNNKIDSQESVERLSDFPVLGKILHNHRKTNNVLFEHPNASISESFRALRTNLEYYNRGGHKKVIMVTSCVAGEGKSFNSLNIAMSYAQLGKRTILLDFDLRKSNTYFKNDGEAMLGLSSYLINRATIDDIVIRSPHENLDYIHAGPIPPNPVELIALEKTEKLLTRLKQEYDYIILDTPPLAQVTDGYLLIDYADVKVVVARYNFTIKKVFSLIMRDIKQKNINHVCVVLNDNRVYNDQYGYGYGYHKN